MGHLFYDMISIINVLFMPLKFYLGHREQKYGLQNGSFSYHIRVLLYFMHISFFSSFSILTLSLFLLGLYFYLNCVIYFLLIYNISNYFVMGHILYDVFYVIKVSFMQLKFYLGNHLQKDCLQNGSFTYHTSVLLLGDMRYTSLEPT